TVLVLALMLPSVIAEDSAGSSMTEKLSKNPTNGNQTAVVFKVLPCPETEYLEMFKLKPGEANMEKDRELLTFYQERIKNALTKGLVTAAFAISDYLAAVANVSDRHVKAAVSAHIATSLVDSPCPRWNLDFEKTVEYVMCDCSHITMRDWKTLIDKTNNTRHDHTVTLFKLALRDLHRCNSVFAWSLLALLYVQHGYEAGMDAFWNNYNRFPLHADARVFWVTHANEPKEVLFGLIMESIRETLHPGEAEIQFHKMDLIVTSLNNMINYEGGWLDRLKAAMASQEELVAAMKRGRHLPPKDPIEGEHVVAGFLIASSSLMVVIAIG
ncbi:hypothetical protein PMAYCL1PPCAC_28136, partial [Pristionchus mayeri]